MDLTAKKANFLSSVVAFSEAMVAVRTAGIAMKKQWDSNQYAAGAPNAIVDADCTGANAHLDATKVTDVVSMQGALESQLWANGYGAYAEKATR